MSEAVRHARYRPTWWRHNRWGLLVLPLALVAALAGSSDRVQLYFWDEGLHHPTTATGGHWVDFHDTYSDSNGSHERRVRVRLDSVRPATTGWQSSDPLPVPPGSRALAVTLSLDADPDLPLSVCNLGLRGRDGTRYDYLPGLGGASQPVSPCVPPDAQGPYPAMGDLTLAPDPDQKPRPRSWTVSPVVIVPAGATISDVDLWWQMPNYVALAVSG